MGIARAVVRWAWLNGPVRWLLAICLVAGAALGFVQTPAARAGGIAPYSGEIVIIENVTVGTHFIVGACNVDGPVLPVTVVALFIPPPGGLPVGPYATASWNGGTGTADMHANTGQAHNLVQTFHMILSAGLLFGGDGKYTASIAVQDVGLAGGYAQRSNVPVLVSPGPPFQAPKTLKCPMVGQVNTDITKALLGIAKDVALFAVKQWGCPFCQNAVTAWKIGKAIGAYSFLILDTARNWMPNDPPDSDYQQIADPSPPPLLPPISGLTAAEQSAVTSLEASFAAAIGDLRGLATSTNRAWGAGDAGSVYWYREQMQAEARFAAKFAADLRKLPAGYDAIAALFTGQLPDIPITSDNVSTALSALENGMPSDFADELTQIGVSAADQKQMARGLLDGDPSQLPTDNATPDLFAPPEDYAAMASDYDNLAEWARQTVGTPRPAITSLSVSSGPLAGGTSVAIFGSNLGSVTGISFGPSSPEAGLGSNLSCSATQCNVNAPAGTGTVDVIADGPGGPSAATPADRFTYQADTAPTVTQIFPASGSVAGGTSVSVIGSGLANGRVYFGPQLADMWTCTAVLCTATAPQSGGPGPVDVTVSNGAGTSATSTADQFTYQATPPPAIVAPTVTGVSPASGSSAGGDTVTITGTSFTSATDIEFGAIPATSFIVQDDSHITAVTPGETAGTTDVTVVNPTGTSAVTSADHFSYVDIAPVITGVSPASGPTTGGTKVTITGTNLNMGDVGLGTGQDLNATCTPTECIGTTPPAVAGPADIRVFTSGGQSALVAADRFTYVKAPAPAITSIEPASGSTAGGTDVAIYGTNLAGATVTIGGQPAMGGVSDTCSLAACLVVAPPGTVGAAAVVVTRTDGAASTAGTYTYVKPGAPSVTAVTPDSGWLQTAGNAEVFGKNLTDGAVYFGSNQALVITGDLNEGSCTPTECSVQVPDGNAPGTVDVTVQTPGGTTATTSADKYTYVFPMITSVSPSTGWNIGGTPVTITGTNLAGGEVGFGTDLTGGFSCTQTTCTGLSPSGSPGTVDVNVSVNNGIDVSAPVAADHFTYQALPPPTVTSVSRASGTDQGGQTLVVTGKYLDGGTISFGSIAVNTGSCTDTTCTVITPYVAPNDGTVDVTVTTQAGTSAASAADQFTFYTPGSPTVTGISTSSGSVVGGTPVTITGTNLTNGNVFFGTAMADSSCTTDNTCTVLSPTASAVGPVDVTVTTINGTSATSPADQFSYQIPPPPAVTSVDPANGPSSGGELVTVTGTNLGGGTVNFGSNAAASSSCGPESCTATQPTGTARAMDITVTTPGGTSATSSADQFTDLSLSLAQTAIPGLASTDQAGGGQLHTAPDGTVWFTIPNHSEVAKIATDGTMTIYPTPDTSSSPDGITQTSNGTIWYVEATPNKIVSLDGTGKQTAYQIPGQPYDLRDIIAGPDGRLWFTLSGSGAIGAMTTSGKISMYTLPDAGAYPLNIAQGPDGRLWFTEGNGDALGAVTTSGQISQYPVPGTGVSPWGITVGLDGRLWSTDRQGHEIDAMTTDGVVTQYPLPVTDGSPVGITPGADGRLWFTMDGFDAVAALDPATGAVADYPVVNTSASALQPKYLAMAKDGSLWVSETVGNTMIHATGITDGVTPTVTYVSPDYGPPGGGTTITIAGANLTGATAVSFGTKKAVTVTDLDAAHVTATAPAGTGAVDVTVTTPNGTTAAGPADKYYYGGPPPALPQVTGVAPATGGTGGGYKVTITGANLTGGSVAVGGTAATAVACTATSCTATTPAGAVGTVDVRVTTAAGTSPVSAADQFTYETPAPPAPTVTGVSPASGTTAGGNTITVTGTDLTGGIVTVGLNDVTATCTATSCTATAPPGAPGTVDVQVTTAGGVSAATAADRYTYAGAPTVPGAPGRPTATAGNAAATVTWTAPSSDGGSGITGYTLIPYRNGVKQAPVTLSGTAVSATVTGLTNGASYSFTVQARNAVGAGVVSLASAAVTPRAPVSLSIASAPSATSYGATVIVTGKVTSSATAVAGVQVVLQYRKHGTATAWTPAGGAVASSATGVVALKLKAPYSVDIRLVSVAAGAYAAGTSAVKTISCSALISATMSPAAVPASHSAVLSGTVSPVQSGVVYLERESGKTWIVVASQKLAAKGAYRFTIKGTSKGTWSYRVMMKATTSFAVSASAVRTLKVT